MTENKGGRFLIVGKDIIITGLQDWDGDIGSNCRNISEQFAQSNRVLFVEPPLDRRTVLRERHRPSVRQRLADRNLGKENIRQVSERLWVLTPRAIMSSINQLPDGRVFDFFNERNNRKFAAEISAAMHRLNFTPDILFTDNDIFRSFFLREFLAPRCFVYYSRDYLVAVPYWKRHGERLEPALIRKADVVVANSAYLADYCRQFNPCAWNVGQGCDLRLFNPDVKPEFPQHAANGKQVVGYVGALTALRLDIPLLEALAQENKDLHFLFVGPEDEAFQRSALHALQNVEFTGPKPMAELPAYIMTCAVCLNPQLLNDITRGNYPRKIDEYLAMGKPVVAAKTPAMDMFAGFTYLALGKEEFSLALRKALAEDCTELQIKRRGFALSHSWENNVNDIYQAILSVKPELS
jgi:glycosyltransferase involved in cell wall biosynthesis